MFPSIRTAAMLGLLAGTVAAGASPPEFTISHVAGTGKADFSGDGGPAAEAQLASPTAVALDSRGNVFIADMKNGRVRRVNPQGIIETVAGTGAHKYQRDDQPALETNLVSAYGIATDHEDNLYIANRGHSKIYKIGADGIARTIAGTGERGYNGDGIPAVEARVSNPNHLVVGPDGVVYVGDSGNRRIRRIGLDGIITTVAGTGETGFSGDGGQAIEARIYGPSAMAMDAAGNLYIADFGNHRIRRIGVDGVIITVAGTGEPKFNGDGLPALESNIGEPCGVAVDHEGVIYIGDQLNLRVRAVTPDGTMYTVAGIGKIGRTGDGGPAVEARISNPDILYVDAAGIVYFPDYMNNMVRKLTRVSR